MWDITAKCANATCLLDPDKLSLNQKNNDLKRYKQLQFFMRDIDRGFKWLLPNILRHTYYRGIYKSRGAELLSKAKIGDIVIPDYGYAFASTSREK